MSGTSQQLKRFDMDDDEEHVWQRQSPKSPIRQDATLDVPLSDEDNEEENIKETFVTKIKNVLSKPSKDKLLQDTIIRLEWSFYLGQATSNLRKIYYTCSREPSRKEMTAIKKKIAKDIKCVSLTVGRRVYVSNFAELTESCSLKHYDVKQGCYLTFESVEQFVNAIEPTIIKINGPEIMTF